MGLGTPEINAKIVYMDIHVLSFWGQNVLPFISFLREISDIKTSWQSMKNQPTAPNVPVKIKNPIVYRILLYIVFKISYYSEDLLPYFITYHMASGLL